MFAMVKFANRKRDGAVPPAATGLYCGHIYSCGFFFLPPVSLVAIFTPVDYSSCHSLVAIYFFLPQVCLMVIYSSRFFFLSQVCLVVINPVDSSSRHRSVLWPFTPVDSSSCHRSVL